MARSRIYVFPVQGKHSFTNDWGGPRSPAATQGTGKHQGNDIFAARGTPVIAPEGGTITKIGWNDAGGNRVWINGRWYLAHLDSYARGMKVGVAVKPGQVIGYVGDTGDAKGTPPHLHLGYDPNGSHGATWENPYPLLVKMRAGDPVEAPKPEQTKAVAEKTSPAAGGDELEPEPTSEPALAPAPAPEQPAEVVPGGMFESGFGVQLPVGPQMPVAPGLLPPGSVDIPFRPDEDPVQTWRMLSDLPNASPQTLRFARRAQETLL